MAVFLAFTVSGCASSPIPIPTPISILTYAADGVSLLVSGKSVTDNALSAAMEQDCVLVRAFQGRLVCRDEGDTSDEERYQLLAAIHGEYSPKTSPFEIAEIDSVESVGAFEGVRQIAQAEAEPAPRAEPQQDRVVAVVTSFQSGSFIYTARRRR